MTSVRLGVALVSAGLLSSACDDSNSTPSPVTQHIAVIEQRVAANNSGDWDTWESLHTENAVRTAPELAEPLVGRASMRAAIEVLASAMPDYKLEVLDAFGENDRLAVRFRASGTFTQPFAVAPGFTIPPTGRAFAQEWTALVRFEGARIAEFNEFADQYDQFVQLGVLSYFTE